jgi:hypothetical protein
LFVGFAGLNISIADVGIAQTVGPVIAASSSDESAQWALDVTVVAIAPDGTWGVATRRSFGPALLSALVDCKRKYGGQVGCGYRSTSVRAGWSLVMRCGRHNIIEAAATLEAAEQAVIDAELALRQVYVPSLPPCIRAVTVNPEGAVVAPNINTLWQLVTDRSRESLRAHKGQ